MPNDDIRIEIRDGIVKLDGYARFIVEENGRYSWFIPGFEMFFSSDTKEDGVITAKAMTKSFFRYWLEKENNFNQMIREITKLGFKSVDHRNTVNKLLRGKKHKAKFTINGQVENDFAHAESAGLELEVA